MELIISKEEINTEELRRNLEEYENKKNVAEQATNEKDEAEDKLLESAGKNPDDITLSWLQYFLLAMGYSIQIKNSKYFYLRVIFELK